MQSTIANMTPQQLQKQLQEQQEALTSLQAHAHLQQVKANLLTLSLRARLRNRLQELKDIRHEHEQQMSALLTHLLYLEGQMQRDHKEIVDILQKKEDVIKQQKVVIENLTAKNDRYLEALKNNHKCLTGNDKKQAHLITDNGNSSSHDHGSKVILRVTENKHGGRAPGSEHKVRFRAMRDKLRRHKSSFELFQQELSDPLIEAKLKYGSEENIVTNNTGKSKAFVWKEKCRSLADYPVALRDVNEDHVEGDDNCFNDYQTPKIYRHDSTSSLMIFDEKTMKNNGKLTFSLPYGFNELSKSRSVPYALPTVSESCLVPTILKERQKSLPSVEVIEQEIPATNTNATKSTSSSKISLAPNQSLTNSSPTSESNPFKTIKNVFKRKSSKKKRSVTLTLGKETNMFKQHFKKFDLI